MYTVARSALVAHSAAQMYSLVNDIPAYAKFLPWCGGGEVLAQSECEMTARIKINYRGIRQSFTTRNQLTPNKKTVMTLVDGPFSELTGAWEFTALGDGCRIAFHLQFDFANAVTGSVVGPVFKHIADSMVDSFVKRADQLYGHGDGHADHADRGDAGR